MNKLGKYKWAELKTCRICGMDAGERMVTDKVPEEFFVVCRICGYKTKKHTSQSHATREWNGGSRE